MKKMVLQIGYTNYAFDLKDALELIAIADRGQEVEQRNYSGPYIAQAKSAPFVNAATLQEVEPAPEPPRAPDTFGAATRAVAVAEPVDVF